MSELLEATSPGNAHNHYRSLRTFFGWLVDEEEIDRSPMEKMNAPEYEPPEVPIIPMEHVSAVTVTGARGGRGSPVVESGLGAARGTVDGSSEA